MAVRNARGIHMVSWHHPRTLLILVPRRALEKLRDSAPERADGVQCLNEARREGTRAIGHRVGVCLLQPDGSVWGADADS